MSIFLFRCIRKLRLHALCYRLLYPFCHSTFGNVEENATAAARRLAVLHPDVNSTSLYKNRMMQPFAYDLQIIIPAYNAGPYIEECIESVLSQRTDFSMLVTVVNDGSTDDTLSVLRKYEERKDFCLINQENKGFSGARNAALEQIRARYIMFVDADDKIPRNAVDVLMRTAIRTNADIVEGGYTRFTDDEIISTFRHREQTTADWRILYGFPVGKVYKSYLFADVHFPPGYWFEDTICLYLLYPRCRKVAVVSDVVYQYRQNEQGITSTSRGRIKTLDALWVTRRILADSRRLGICPTSSLYDAFLQDLQINLTRFVSLDETVHRDAFGVTAALLREYFLGFRTEDARLRPFEQALLTCDYGAYRLNGKCYLCV